MQNADLAAAAEAVLDANWLGGSTLPGPRLYPHQWSWDSAFAAIGNAERASDRARAELTSLFDAQWSNGLLPHIVFHPETRYWRGPAWVNVNWLISRGLRRHGFGDYAEAVRTATLALVREGGFREYFDPLTGEGLGSDQFSWTAALTLDLLRSA